MGIDKQPNGSFKVTIMIDRKRIYIGYFISYEKALNAYNERKKKNYNYSGRKLKTHIFKP
jgi:hypothetical protein